MKREPFILLVFGMTGVGKTFLTMQILEHYVTFHKRPVLILDVNNEFNGSGDYGEYKAIAYDVEEENEAKRVRNIKKIKKPAIYRLLPRYKDGLQYDDRDIVKSAEDIFTHFTNGLFFLEDINVYVQKNVPKKFYSRITTARHSGADIVIHYQNVGDPAPQIIKNSTFVRLHKTGDSVTTFSTDKYLNHKELMRISELAIESRYSQGVIRTSCYIHMRKQQIYGLSKEEFKNATAYYLSENPSIVKNLLRRRNVKGQLIYKNEEQVYEDYINEKLDKMYLPPTYRFFENN